MQIHAPRTWLFGDDLNTDVIHPPQFFSLDPDVVRGGLFHGLDPEMQPAMRPNDILVGGSNFGCGSSRETSVRSLKLNRVGCIVAVSFARIFFRNATNNGLPCLTFEDPADRERVPDGTAAVVDTERWVLQFTDAAGETVEIQLTPAGQFIQEIWRAGGLLGLLPEASPS